MFKNINGGIKAKFKSMQGDDGKKYVEVRMQATGHGKFGKGKFFDMGVRADGVMFNYKPIKIKFIKPISVEI